MDSIKIPGGKNWVTVTGALDDRTYEINKYQKWKNKHVVRIDLGGKPVYAYIVDNKGRVTLYNNNPSNFQDYNQDSKILSYLVHYSISLIGLKELKVPFDVNAVYLDMKIRGDWKNKRDGYMAHLKPIKKEQLDPIFRGSDIAERC